jgi:hypothetical protein
LKYLIIRIHYGQHIIIYTIHNIMDHATISLTGKYVVLKGEEDFEKRLAFCYKQQNDTIYLKSVYYNVPKDCNINEIDYYLKINNISNLKIGQNITYMTNNEYYETIYDSGIIIDIKYYYKNIIYTIFDENSKCEKIINDDQILEKNSDFVVGNYVNVSDKNNSFGFNDGIIISIDLINDKYKIKLENNNIVVLSKSELQKPNGFYIIKI